MATKDTNYLVAVHKGLDESLEKQVAALPEKFNKQRFLQNCMTVLQDGQADFSKCEAPTVVRTLLKVVARVWDGEKNRPTNVYCEYENIKRCEDDVMSAGFIFKFPRTPEDDACIVETYMR